MRLTLFCLVMLALVPACAPSPYYTERHLTTPGEIPRDANGEPVWALVRTSPQAVSPAPNPRPALAALPLPDRPVLVSDIGKDVPLGAGAGVRAGALAGGADVLRRDGPQGARGRPAEERVHRQHLLRTAHAAEHHRGLRRDPRQPVFRRPDRAAGRVLRRHPGRDPAADQHHQRHPRPRLAR